MLSERQLNALLERFETRMQGVTEEYLRKMGEHLRDLGKLSASDVNRLIELKRVGTNVKRVKQSIAAAAEASVKDVEEAFRAAAESDVRFAAKFFAESAAPAVKGAPKLSTPLERILKAQLRVTAQEFKNLSQTTILSEKYCSAVDVAVETVQTGIEDYTTAIRRAMKAAAADGLRVTYPNSGLTRRLDSAVRQNVLDGVRALNNDILAQLGKEYGANGVEISAHALCAEDHLPYQGRQFSEKEFERIQNNLDRPFGMWNCKHTIFPVILGVSVPANDADELALYQRNSTEAVTIDGRTMSRYQWSQEQRRIETAVRAQKDIAIAAKAAGDDLARREAQAKINALRERYESISEKAGLNTESERMTVAGFRRVKTVEQLKRSEKSGIIQVAGEVVNTRMKSQKQQEHIWGSKAFIQRTETAKANGKSLPSAFYQDTDVEKLVKANMGKGRQDKNKQGVLSEYFDAKKNVGWVYLEGARAYEGTSHVCIRYSRNGWHAYPVKKPKEK